MFHIRLENTDAHTMTDNEIKSARIIAYNAERLSDTAAHMLNINRAILNGNHINLTRAARNIARIHNLLTQCWGEVDSLHECYLAQYTDFDDDGDYMCNLPEFDFSEQSILDDRAFYFWTSANVDLANAMLDFAERIGHSLTLFSARSTEGQLRFLREHVMPAIAKSAHTAKSQAHKSRNVKKSRKPRNRKTAKANA